jgi:hypothetical protein
MKNIILRRLSTYWALSLLFFVGLPPAGTAYAATSEAEQQNALGKTPPDQPDVIHWCARHCITLVLQNGHYSNAEEPGKSEWILDSLTKESFAMQRTDFQVKAGETIVAGKAVLSGRLSEQGNSVTDGKITWTYHPCCGTGTSSFTAAWGAALNTVPGSDKERDGRQQSAELPANMKAEKINGVPKAQIAVCTSKAIQAAMQFLENKVARDPNGALLSGLVNALTGVKASAESATVVDSRMSTDGGRYTSKDPGSFICEGLFVHEGVHIKADPESPGASDLSGAVAEKGKQVMAQRPQFAEWYKVKPLETGRYRLKLIPVSVPLSQDYVTDFAYPTP